MSTENHPPECPGPQIQRDTEAARDIAAASAATDAARAARRKAEAAEAAAQPGAIIAEAKAKAQIARAEQQKSFAAGFIAKAEAREAQAWRAAQAGCSDHYRQLELKAQADRATAAGYEAAARQHEAEAAKWRSSSNPSSGDQEDRTAAAIGDFAASAWETLPGRKTPRTARRMIARLKAARAERKRRRRYRC